MKMNFTIMNKSYITIKILLVLFLLSGTLLAQKEPNDRIHSLKIAFITEKLNLSTEEAQSFWPVYNAHRKQMRSVKSRKRNLLTSLDDTRLETISDNDAKKTIIEIKELDIKEMELKNQFLEKLNPILTAPKILQLIKVETEFKRKLIKQLKHKK